MADAVILNNFRVAYRILCRNVQRVLACHDGNYSLLDAQVNEACACFQEAEKHKEVFQPDEYATLKKSVNQMVKSLLEARWAAADPAPPTADPGRPCTEMHRSWRIPEIVQEIVSYFDATGNDFSARAQLACLARTSRIFHEQALDALWRRTWTMVNLVKCMPGDLWELASIPGRTTMVSADQTLPALPHDSTFVETLRRPIVATDWERLLHYSHRVKSLSVRPKSVEDLGQIYDFLLHTAIPGQYLLPNLVSLKCLSGSDHIISPTHFSLFLTPRLREIELGTSYISLFPALIELPDLQTVTVWSDRSSSGPQQHVSALIRGLRNLHSLHTPFVDLPALVHLGKLNTLTTLKVSPMPSGPYSTMYEQGLFSNTRCMDLSFDQADERFVPEFIRTWTNPPLSSLTLTMDRTPSEQVMRDVFDALADRIDSKSLQTLRVGITWHVRAEALAGDILKPLASFINLTDVFIMVTEGYNMDDSLMSELARAWPHLTSLKLETARNDHRQVPPLTLASLRTLASHCPGLRDLELTFDATSIPAAHTEQPEHRVLQYSLRSLHAAHSPIASAIDVARYLSGVFPKLAAVRGTYDDDHNEDEMTTERGRLGVKWSLIWREVEELLPVLCDIRGEEYEWGRQSIAMSEYMTFEFP